jgi:hypothetical protein
MDTRSVANSGAQGCWLGVMPERRNIASAGHDISTVKDNAMVGGGGQDTDPYGPAGMQACPPESCG